MAIASPETAGPNITSGTEIKFSTLRKYFLKMNPRGSFTDSDTDFEPETGSISASQLLRQEEISNDDLENFNVFSNYNDLSKREPFVPDSTENSQIATSTNWKFSQFIGSVKYYYIQQTSAVSPTNDDLNLKIDNLNWNGNLEKSIRKTFFIDGTIGSNQSDHESVKVDGEMNNFTFVVSGNVYGASGEGGLPNIYPNKGGDCFRLKGSDNTGGKNIYFNVLDSAKIYAGGGGAGQGSNGGRGGFGGPAYGNCNYPFWNGKKWVNYCSDCSNTPTSGLYGTPGTGGEGGFGRGYANANEDIAALNGKGGTGGGAGYPGNTAGCSGSVPGFGGQGGTAGSGGLGGEWTKRGGTGTSGYYGHKGTNSTGCGDSPCARAGDGLADSVDPTFPGLMLRSFVSVHGISKYYTIPGNFGGRSIVASKNYNFFIFNENLIKGGILDDLEPDTHPTYYSPIDRAGTIESLGSNTITIENGLMSDFVNSNGTGPNKPLKVSCSTPGVLTARAIVTSISTIRTGVYRVSVSENFPISLGTLSHTFNFYDNVILELP